MDITLYSERLTVVLGYITLASAIATFGTCRACLSFLNRLGIKNPINSKWYQPYYRLHGFYWWGFVMGLALHLMAALMHTGIPKSSDPDGWIHRIVLETGGASFILTAVVFSACRSLVNLVSSFKEKPLLANKGFLDFYRYHSLFWVGLILLVAGHFAAVYIHIGFWPW